MLRLSLALFLYFVLVPNIIAKDVTIGVLAYNGKLQALERWQTTADYLSASIPAHKFKIIPLTLQDFENSLNKQKLNFILTNPGHYVILKDKFEAHRMLTFLSQYNTQTLQEFSAVIFTRKDSGIKQLRDLKGKTFAAVSRDAFGGFQLAQDALLDEDIDAIKDMNIKWLGFPHADIVKAVLSKSVDAGTVRSGVLEKMAAAGEIDLNDFHVLALKQNIHYPFLHSVDMYPEWPLAKLPWTDVSIAREVAINLLKVRPTDAIAIASLGHGWTIPLDYSAIYKVLKRLQIGPYTNKKIEFWQLVKDYKYLLLLIIGAIVSLLFFLVKSFKKNKTLKNKQHIDAIKRHDLQSKLSNIDLDLKHKTEEYLQTKKSLSADFKAMQDLYDIFLNVDIKREQKLNLIVDAVKKDLNMELGMLSQFSNNCGFKLCGSCAQNDVLHIAPIDKTLAQEAIESPGIFIKHNTENHKIYVAYAIFIQNNPRCLFEFSSLQDVDLPEFGLKLLTVAAQHVSKEILYMEKDKCINQRNAAIQQRFSYISEREKEVLVLLSKGNSTKVIARSLNISPKTVEMHRASLINKTQSKSSIELVQLAVLAKVIPNIQ